MNVWAAPAGWAVGEYVAWGAVWRVGENPGPGWERIDPWRVWAWRMVKLPFAIPATPPNVAEIRQDALWGFLAHTTWHHTGMRSWGDIQIHWEWTDRGIVWRMKERHDVYRTTKRWVIAEGADVWGVWLERVWTDDAWRALTAVMDTGDWSFWDAVWGNGSG